MPQQQELFSAVLERLRSRWASAHQRTLDQSHEAAASMRAAGDVLLRAGGFPPLHSEGEEGSDDGNPTEPTD